MPVADWHDVIPYARKVYARHSAGCCAHIVLDDGNVDNADVDYCLGYALDNLHTNEGDEISSRLAQADCVALCLLLNAMTKTQRSELFNAYREYA